MNIILEGPDGSGKSMLLSWLSGHLKKPTSVHHGPYKGLSSEELCWEYHRSLETDDDKLRIIDRSWLSEPIYGSVYRPNEPVRVDSAQRRALERQAGNSVVVLCLPSYERCRQAFSGRPEVEMLDDEHQLLQVYARYASLKHQTSLPVISYDYTMDPPGSLLHRVKALLAQASRRRIVLVGEQANIRLNEPLGERAPFTAYNKQGCSYWLNSMLDEAGIPEQLLLWVNARTELGRPTNPQNIKRKVAQPFTTIALGQTAAAWCEACGLGPTHQVRHPQHHKRFSHSEPYALIGILKELTHEKVPPSHAGLAQLPGRAADPRQPGQPEGAEDR